MTTLSPEMRSILDRAGERPVRIEDPETLTAYVLLKEEDYDRLRGVIEESDLSLHEFEEITLDE